MPKNQELLTFPCQFSIKAVGVNQANLIDAISALIKSKVPNFNPQQDLSFKLSKQQNYLSITINILATSKEMLDDLYLALNQHELIKITL